MTRPGYVVRGVAVSTGPSLKLGNKVYVDGPPDLLEGETAEPFGVTPGPTADMVILWWRIRLAPVNKP